MPRIELPGSVLSIPPIDPINLAIGIYRETPTFSSPSDLLSRANSLTKPSLAHPDTFRSPPKSITEVMGNILKRLEECKQKFQEMLDLEINQIYKLSNANLEKHLLKTEELDKVITKSDYWDFLTKIGAYLIGSASIVLGASLLVPGANTLAIVAGCAMILSGGASIGGSILSELRTHPQLATALMITGSGLAIVGGVTGAFLGATSIATQFGRIIAASLSVVTSGAEILKDRYLWQAADIKASEALIKKTDEVYKAELTALNQDLSYFEKETSATTTNLIIAHKRLQVSMQRTLELSA